MATVDTQNEKKYSKLLWINSSQVILPKISSTMMHVAAQITNHQKTVSILNSPLCRLAIAEHRGSGENKLIASTSVCVCGIGTWCDDDDDGDTGDGNLTTSRQR